MVSRIPGNLTVKRMKLKAGKKFLGGKDCIMSSRHGAHSRRLERPGWHMR